MSRMLKIQVSSQNTGLFCRALLQKRPIFLSILLIVATPYDKVIRHHEMQRHELRWKNIDKYRRISKNINTGWQRYRVAKRFLRKMTYKVRDPVSLGHPV